MSLKKALPTPTAHHPDQMATDTQKPTTRNPEIEAETETKTEIPKKTETLTTPTPLDLNQHSSADADADADADKSSAPPTTAAVVSPTAADDIQRKMKRAERFGVPVQLSEEEKRNSRSERFGTITGSEVSKSAEEQKRKARAERFGITVPADEEVKKKSRVERFGSDAKVDTKVETKVNSVEEEKRKARALRFSDPKTAAVDHSNGNGDSNSKIATVDNANEGA